MKDRSTYIAIFESAVRAEWTALMLQNPQLKAAKVSFVTHENGSGGRVVGFYYSGGRVRFGSTNRVWISTALSNLGIPASDVVDCEISLGVGRYVLVVVGGASDSRQLQKIARETRPRVIRQYVHGRHQQLHEDGHTGLMELELGKVSEV